ncbi:MAG: peptidoglycan-binding protein [Proteobacteria bacterium]|nr:peptidoglycan-binding protein [Pseudomonadota bacterium]
MARRYLFAWLLLFCTACATPHDLVPMRGVDVEQVCEHLQEAGYDTGGCLLMWAGKLRAAIKQFQEHQRLTPADGLVNAETWLRLQTVVMARRKPESKAAPAQPAAAKPSSGAVPQSAPPLPPAKAAPPVKPAPAPQPPPPPPPPPLREGMQVLVVERAKCLPRSGAWVLAYVGVVRSLEEDKILVTLTGRLSYRYNPGEKGVDPKDWFCVPRRRHCYSAVPFGDWGGRHRPGEAVLFETRRVRHLDQKPERSLYGVVKQTCR